MIKASLEKLACAGLANLLENFFNGNNKQIPLSVFESLSKNNI